MRNSCGLISRPCMEGLWCHGWCDKWTPTLTRTLCMHLSAKTEIQSHQVTTFMNGNTVCCAGLIHLRAVSLPNMAARAMEELVSQSVTALGNHFLCLMGNPSLFGENFANSCSVLSKFNYSLLWKNKNQRLIIIDTDVFWYYLHSLSHFIHRITPTYWFWPRVAAKMSILSNVKISTRFMYLCQIHHVTPQDVLKGWSWS